MSLQNIKTHNLGISELPLGNLNPIFAMTMLPLPPSRKYIIGKRVMIPPQFQLNMVCLVNVGCPHDLPMHHCGSNLH